jgi:hypothetical protein
MLTGEGRYMLERENLASNGGGGDTTQGDLDQSLMTTFCRTLDHSRLPPMTVMHMMAAALGAIYRQVATSHQNEECPCGWHPAPASDIEALQFAVRATAEQQPAPDLRAMPVVGRA